MLISKTEESEALLLTLPFFFFKLLGVTKIEEIPRPKRRGSSICHVLCGIASSPTGGALKDQHQRQGFTHPRIWRIYLASSTKEVRACPRTREDGCNKSHFSHQFSFPEALKAWNIRTSHQDSMLMSGIIRSQVLKVTWKLSAWSVTSFSKSKWSQFIPPYRFADDFSPSKWEDEVTFLARTDLHHSQPWVSLGED